MDVGAWLRGLGLEQYAPAFRANDVDSEVLPELTADDLIGLGVTSIGSSSQAAGSDRRPGDGAPNRGSISDERDICSPLPSDNRR